MIVRKTGRKGQMSLISRAKLKKVWIGRSEEGGDERNEIENK